MCILLSVGCATTQPAVYSTPGEARFFSDCPQRASIQLHNERSPWDLHAITYTSLGLSELEVFRTADWLIDLPLPGPHLRPLHRLIEAVRAGYHWLPPWQLTQRVGEFVDAWQIPELSFGDATATYSVTTGGVTGPGSGMIVRLHKLIDWTQHVTGDLNRMVGRAVGRRQGLIAWSLPERAVDGTQRLLIVTFHHASLLIARTLEHGLTGVEMAGEAALQIGATRPHRDTTVFLRLPMAVYRAHELWVLEHHDHLVVGSREEWWRSTHAELAHARRAHRVMMWQRVDQLAGDSTEVIIMTTTRVIARAPDSLTPYVVPAAWVVDKPEGSL